MRVDVDVLDGGRQELLLLPCPVLSLLRQQLDLVSVLALQLSLGEYLPRSCRPFVLEVILVLDLRLLRGHDFLDAWDFFEFVLGPHFSDQEMQLF